MKTDAKISVVTGVRCGGWRAGSLQLALPTSRSTEDGGKGGRHEPQEVLTWVCHFILRRKGSRSGNKADRQVKAHAIRNVTCLPYPQNVKRKTTVTQRATT